MARPVNKDALTLSQQYGITYKSASDWLKKGCPVSSSIEQDTWVASQKRLHLKANTNQSGSTNIVIQPETTLGAGAALERVEKVELYYFNEWQKAKVNNDATLERTARENYLKASESLRKQDIALEESRRAAGVQLPKEQILLLISRFLYASRVALKKVKQNLAPQLAASSNPIEIDLLLDQTYLDVWQQAVNDLIGESIPAWLKQSIIKELQKATDE